MADNSDDSGPGSANSAGGDAAASKKATDVQSQYIGIGIALGVSIGVALSLVLDSWAYVGLGIALGVVFGISFGQQKAASIVKESAPDGDGGDTAPGAGRAPDDPKL